MERNRYASAATKSIIAYPGKVYNPLILYGEQEAGKTHY